MLAGSSFTRPGQGGHTPVLAPGSAQVVAVPKNMTAEGYRELADFLEGPGPVCCCAEP